MNTQFSKEANNVHRKSRNKQKQKYIIIIIITITIIIQKQEPVKNSYTRQQSFKAFLSSDVENGAE